MTTLREISRTPVTSDKVTYEAINAGSLQRIADATELIKKRVKPPHSWGGCQSDGVSSQQIAF